MENLLKKGGNNYDLDMDVLLKKSMDPVDEGGDSSKKEEKAKKSSKKELQEESPELTDSDPQEDTSKQKPSQNECEVNEVSAVITTDTTNGDYGDDKVKVASEESTDVFGDERDECAEYKAKFFKDSTLTDKFIVVRVNDELAQKIRVVLWHYPDLSTSSYVNNILQHHFDEFRSVLEAMAREVSESVIEVMS